MESYLGISLNLHRDKQDHNLCRLLKSTVLIGGSFKDINDKNICYSSKNLSSYIIVSLINRLIVLKNMIDWNTQFVLVPISLVNNFPSEFVEVLGYFVGVAHGTTWHLKYSLKMLVGR